MDFVNVLSAAPSMTPVATIQNGGLQGNDQTSFQSQLIFYTQTNSQASSSELEQTAGVIPPVLTEEVIAIVDGQWTSEELDVIIDDLLDQLHSMQEQSLSKEQIELLLPFMEQLAALLQLLGVPQGDSTVQVVNSTDLQSQTSQEQQKQLITKLQDQLLQLQQNVEQGSVKLFQGKQPEVIIGQQLQKFSSTLSELGEPSNKKVSSNQTQGNTNFVEQGKVSSDASTYLQRMADETSYKFTSQTNVEVMTKSVQGEQSQSQTQDVSFVKTDVVKDINPLLTKSGTPTSYVMTDDFAEKIKGMIVQKFSINSLNGVSEAKLQLTPEHLGQVDVKISMNNGIMTAVFQAETAMGKNALENQMAQLRASLAAQGITVEKIEVAQATFATQLNEQQQQQQKRFANQQNKEKQEQHELNFEDELIGNASIKELGFGRSVNEVV